MFIAGLIARVGCAGVMNEHVLIHHGSDNQDNEHAMMVVAGVTDYSARSFDDGNHQTTP
jgi:hypothetical protein